MTLEQAQQTSKTPSHVLTFGYFWFGTSCNVIGCRPEFLSNAVRVDPRSPATGIPIQSTLGRDDGLWKLKKQDLWYIHLLTHQSYCSFDICFGSALCTSRLPACVSPFGQTLHMLKNSRTKWTNMNKLETRMQIWVDHYTTTVPFLPFRREECSRPETWGASAPAPGCHGYDRM